jgi:predicted MFS family arabinose efflux permease
MLAAVGLALMLLALSEGPAVGWLQPTVVAATLSSVASLAILVRAELRKLAPLVNLRLFSNRLFAATNLVSFGASAGFIGLLFLVPLFLQDVVGVPAVVSGLTTFPEAIGVLVATQISGRLYPTVGPRRLMIGGLAWVTLIIGTMVFLSASPDLWVVRLQMFLVGAGMAFVFLPLQAASFATISSADTGRASALFSTQAQLAAAFGVAVLASVLAAGSTSVDAQTVPSAAQLDAFRLAFAVAAGFAALGALAALGIHDQDAASTMRLRLAKQA